MVEQDKIIGAIMAIVGIFAIIIEGIYLILQPLTDKTVLDNMPRAQYWGMAIPLFLAWAGVLAIVIWIGVTMIRTPPPEVMEFEDFEDVDLDDEVEDMDEVVDQDDDEGEEDEEEPEDEETGDLELTDINGVGSSSADVLRDAGYTTVKQVAEASVDDLSSIKGVGKATAQKYIDGAKELL